MSPALATARPGPESRTVAPPTTAGALDRYYHQTLHWGTCMRSPQDGTGRDLDKAGVQCADVTVPLDYTAPGGRTVTLALSRLKATDTRRRIGAILLNNGGSGGPAVDSPPIVRTAMKEVGPRYDIVGFDPRFVGRSTPLDCGWPVSFTWFSAGASRAGFDRQVALSKSLAAKCRATNASVLPHITTRNTARDMDVIRGALGERKISYLGYSYGTYLGTVYTQMFPGRYDRMVLDGAVGPDDYDPRLLKDTVRENEQALSAWAAWAAARHTTYGLGRSRTAVLATIDHVMAKASRAPLTLGTARDVFRVDDTHIPTLLFMGVADDVDDSRDFLARQVAALSQASKGREAPLPPEFAETLRLLLSGADSPTAAHRWRSSAVTYRPRARPSATGATSNGAVAHTPCSAPSPRTSAPAPSGTRHGKLPPASATTPPSSWSRPRATPAPPTRAPPPCTAGCPAPGSSPWRTPTATPCTGSTGTPAWTPGSTATWRRAGSRRRTRAA